MWQQYTGAWTEGPLPRQRTFRHCQKKICVAHILTSWPTCVGPTKSHWNPWKHSETITRNNAKKPRVNILYTGAWTEGPLPGDNALSRHCQKMCRSHPYLKANMCTNWNPWKRSETITWNMRKNIGLTFYTQAHGRRGPLPWQRTFRHCQKVCRSYYLHLKANMCAKSHWNPWKHSETITRNVRKKTPRVNIVYPPPPPATFSGLAGILAWISDSGKTGRNVCVSPPPPPPPTQKKNKK